MCVNMVKPSLVTALGVLELVSLSGQQTGCILHIPTVSHKSCVLGCMQGRASSVKTLLSRRAVCQVACDWPGGVS